jgi:hypothetical protein
MQDHSPSTETPSCSEKSLIDSPDDPHDEVIHWIGKL